MHIYQLYSYRIQLISQSPVLFSYVFFFRHILVHCVAIHHIARMPAIC